MKVLFAIKSLALQGGGTERIVAQISAELARRGQDVTVACFDQPKAQPFYALDPRVRLVTLGIGAIERATNVGEAFRRIAALRRLALSARPNVAVGFMHSTYIPLGIALLGTGIPVIASEHIGYDHYRTVPRQAALIALTPFLCDAITAISPAIREGFPLRLRRRMVVVPNPVNLSDKRPADVTGATRPIKTLLAAGRLTYQKDHKTLIEAFAALADRFPDWQLRIVGEGELRPRLEAQVRSHGLGDRISMPGTTSNIDDEYVASQLFAMPSLYESFGLTTAEALIHSLPVVGFADCPGTNELVQNGVNGVLVTGTDRAAALAEALARLMGSAELRARLGAAGPSSIEAFAPERIADIWEALLARIAARAPE
jgi:GalNAc-alpha-(1->4)-GalNAc-alpha-(1->3)-diNAcBac-PP-undecaprenol alpha-1,4-N-acetyl-D-galactosaminyltransferase